MKFSNPGISSSYAANRLGETLYNYILVKRPKHIGEFGIYNAYSTICMAQALDEIGEGKITAYDLWDTNEKRGRSSMDVAVRNVVQAGLDKYVTIEQGNFWDIDCDQFDMIHLDIDNDGEILERAAEKLKNYKGMVIFEGGSEERDNCPQMNGRKKMHGSAKYVILNPRFPSMSMLICKTDDKKE